MKKWAYLIVLFVIFAICRPANGEILIYNFTKTGGKDFMRLPQIDYPNGNDHISDGKGRGRGCLILDVDFSQMGISFLTNNAVQISYSRKGNKTYSVRRYNFDGEQFFAGRYSFDGEKIFPGSSSYWVLTHINTPQADEAVVFMLSGETAMTNIGSGQNRKRIPKKLDGTYLVSVTIYNSQLGHDFLRKTMLFTSLRLNTQMTKQANQYWYDYEQAGGAGFNYTPFEWAEGGVDQADDIYGIVIAKLELSGYHEPDPNSINIDLWSL